jgi:hypothetical protein
MDAIPLIDDLPLRIARLRLRPDDVLLVRSKKSISEETAGRIKETLTAVLPRGVRVVVHDGDFEFSVVSPVAPSACGRPAA